MKDAQIVKQVKETILTWDISWFEDSICAPLFSKCLWEWMLDVHEQLPA